MVFLCYEVIKIKIQYRILTFVAIVIIVCGIILYMWLRTLFPYSSQQEIEKEFYKNYEAISELTSYIENTGFVNINIQDTDYIYDDGNYGTWYVQSGDANDAANNGRKEIGDDKVVKELLRLFKEKRYQVINKHGNAISFQLNSTLDMGAGIVYSIDGAEPSMQILTKLEALDKDNWYYYESDFNEWRRLNWR